MVIAKLLCMVLPGTSSRFQSLLNEAKALFLNRDFNAIGTGLISKPPNLGKMNDSSHGHQECELLLDSYLKQVMFLWFKIQIFKEA